MHSIIIIFFQKSDSRLNRLKEIKIPLQFKWFQLQDENEVLKNNLTSTSTEIRETEQRIIGKHKELKTVCHLAKLRTSAM